MDRERERERKKDKEMFGVPNIDTQLPERLVFQVIQQAQPKYHISNDLKGATHWVFIRDTRRKVLGNERATMQKNKD